MFDNLLNISKAPITLMAFFAKDESEVYF